MRQVLIKELWACTPETLARRLGVDLARASLCIETLTTRGVLKLRTDNDAREYEGGSLGVQRGMYQFVYVGLAIFEDLVIIVHPKYLKEEDATPERLRQIIRVLRKSAGSFAEIAAASEEGLKANDRLALMLTILEMYGEYGLYDNEERILKKNGGGEINWERTIAKHDAYISNGIPVYIDFETNETARQTADFITRLHRFVLTESSTFMAEHGLSELLGLDEIELSTDEREDLGDTASVLYKLDQERSVQFVTWKQQLLDLLVRYFNDDSVLVRSEEVLCLGSTSFYHAWEKACCVALGDVLNDPIDSLGIKLSPEWQARRRETLISIIPRPRWFKATADGEKECGAMATLIPDALVVRRLKGSLAFGIFDAKYYTPSFGGVACGVPGVESITKQHLYQAAYKDFILKNGIERVANVFLVPGCSDEVEMLARVEFDEVLGVEEPPLVNGITMYALPADEVWDCYLSNERFGDDAIAAMFEGCP